MVWKHSVTPSMAGAETYPQPFCTHAQASQQAFQGCERRRDGGTEYTIIEAEGASHEDVPSKCGAHSFDHLLEEIWCRLEGQKKKSAPLAPKWRAFSWVGILQALPRGMFLPVTRTLGTNLSPLPYSQLPITFFKTSRVMLYHLQQSTLNSWSELQIELLLLFLF